MGVERQIRVMVWMTLILLWSITWLVIGARQIDERRQGEACSPYHTACATIFQP